MLVATPEKNRLRSASSFAVSSAVHGAVLAWVALVPLVPPPRPGLYEQEIRPYENKIVWYNLNERLPAITPPQRDVRPPRARVRAPQVLVSGPQENQRPPQLIWTPAPEIETQRVLQAPNVIALTPPAAPLRDFTLPPDLMRPEKAPSLPEAPAAQIAKLKPVDLMQPRGPQPRAFTPPQEVRPEIPKAALPAAPELTIVIAGTPAATPLLPPIQAARRTFIPPVEAAHAPALQTANLPAGPVVEIEPAATIALLPGAPSRLVRPFAAPAAAAPAAPTQPANLPAAPQIEARRDAGRVALPETAIRVVRPFSAPVNAGRPAATTMPLADAPLVQTGNRTPEAALAIVSLFPTRDAPVPAPQSSQKAGFSAGPQPRPDGGDSSAQAGPLTIPGLLIQSAGKDERPTLMATLQPPTSPANLAAAARSVPVTAPGATGETPAMRVTTAPDPRLDGRTVYTIAIQMPNVTSYSGSWIVWFAESEPMRNQAAAAIRAPAPLRKVDPKYIPAAADEKVEGKVRLAAVIRRDGHVEHVELLQRLDDRLDLSSEEALAKWEFEPALRNGVAIDVDAVFEIPFHIAPKVPK